MSDPAFKDSNPIDHDNVYPKKRKKTVASCCLLWPQRILRFKRIFLKENVMVQGSEISCQPHHPLSISPQLDPQFSKPWEIENLWDNEEQGWAICWFLMQGRKYKVIHKWLCFKPKWTYKQVVLMGESGQDEPRKVLSAFCPVFISTVKNLLWTSNCKKSRITWTICTHLGP